MSRYVTFTIADGLYGVDVLRVQEALRAHARTRVPLAPPGIAGLVNLRGQVVLTVDLRPRLGLPPLGADAEPMMVVVQVDGEPVSLLVDEIGDVLDVPADQVGAPPETLDAELRPLIRSACTLDERLLLVLDVDEAAAA
ncbi:chemotaxis protein CheW [Cellulomonas fimi]|uniref:CheW protein n=1 Tax=Cellulomonas fimi (strain ATCC 484 / DSM 20113 / JCM 1341 / CCUG 24087 / LMG 16345 / NBRC 15513 / NCIMB 8980 / NCTC 7547 / NRS-133) TaxID=590998 RepID=F4GZC4_CELFA|nr:chemotaxis protein CheW [Cellulomonas fimi]AEE44845.1 CheW protein [Cellulomonas fimi ATCC 484]NNH08081.1 chemotaxis protein CheW [Cellulomonas fimi]VEH27461.1 Coupling protein CheW [Cellulomonas fimi]